ncbi:MAG: hypothetical protein RL173_179 [Fibrobacterota bacterium]|jgi:phosphoglycolate phosphatase-like HAD superfamily hydrolase
MIVLDFDGVLFDSAWEAYEVGHLAVFGNRHSAADTKRWELFRALRCKILTAWQYKPVFDSIRLGEALPKAVLRLEASLKAGPGLDDKVFESKFFGCRAEWVAQDKLGWLNLSKPTHFFTAIHPLLAKHPDQFVIVSTRNEESIKEILKPYIDPAKLGIYGSASFQANGESKTTTIRRVISGQPHSLFIDDGEEHIRAAEGIPGLQSILAGWGYVPAQKACDNASQVSQIILDLLKEA